MHTGQTQSKETKFCFICRKRKGHQRHGEKPKHGDTQKRAAQSLHRVKSFFILTAKGRSKPEAKAKQSKTATQRQRTTAAPEIRPTTPHPVLYAAARFSLKEHPKSKSIVS